MNFRVRSLVVLFSLALALAYVSPALADEGGEERQPSGGENVEAQPSPEEPPIEEAAPAEEPTIDEPPPPETSVTSAGPPPLSQPLTPVSEPPPPATPPAGKAVVTAPQNLTGITTVPAKPLEPKAEPLPAEPEDAAPPVAAEPAVVGPTAPMDDSAAASEPVNQPPPMSAYRDDDEQKFAAFSFSPQIGYAYFPKSEFEYDGLKFSVDKRNSFVLKLHLDMGGDGLAFELAPLLAYQKIGGDISSFGTDLSSGVAGSLLAVGGQMNLMVRGSWGSFFPHLGIGFHGAYLFGDGIEYGADIYGRIPLGFTWYVAKHLGVVVEFAFMLGVTGIRKKMPNTAELYADLEADGVSQEQVESINWKEEDWQTEAGRLELAAELGISGEDAEAKVNEIIEEQVSKVIQFGRGYGFEFMVGVRFP